MARRWAVVALLVTSCGSPTAPAIGASTEVCAPTFCITAPSGWEAEVAEGAISFRYATEPTALVFASIVDMAWMLESTGSSWPASLESVAGAYWTLLALAPESVLVSPDGWVESRGHFEGLPRWHALYPVDGGPQAVAVTVQLPAESWGEHARAFLEGVEPVEASAP